MFQTLSANMKLYVVCLGMRLGYETWVWDLGMGLGYGTAYSLITDGLTIAAYSPDEPDVFVCL